MAGEQLENYANAAVPTSLIEVDLQVSYIHELENYGDYPIQVTIDGQTFTLAISETVVDLEVGITSLGLLSVGGTGKVKLIGKRGYNGRRIAALETTATTSEAISDISLDFINHIVNDGANPITFCVDSVPSIARPNSSFLLQPGEALENLEVAMNRLGHVSSGGSSAFRVMGRAR